MQFSSALKLNHIFQRLYRTSGQADALMVLYARPNKLGRNRVGITAGKKLGHAVVRNRVKRRIREVYRLSEASLTPGWDIVIVARSRCIDVPFEKMMTSFEKLSSRAGICRQEESEG